MISSERGRGKNNGCNTAKKKLTIPVHYAVPLSLLSGPSVHAHAGFQRMRYLAERSLPQEYRAALRFTDTQLRVRKCTY